MGRQEQRKAISFSSIEKDIFLTVHWKRELKNPFYGLNAQGENPRELESRQIVRLISMVAEAYYANGKYDFSRSVEKIEHRLKKGENILDDHLRAYRIGREEVLSAWLAFVGKIIENYFITVGKIVDRDEFSNTISRNSFGST
jgi:hypothetical protein